MGGQQAEVRELVGGAEERRDLEGMGAVNIVRRQLQKPPRLEALIAPEGLDVVTP